IGGGAAALGPPPPPHCALPRKGKGEAPRRRWVVRLALLAEGILAGLGRLPCQRKRRQGGAPFLLLVPLRLRLLLFLGTAHLTLGRVVPPAVGLLLFACVG